MVLTDLSRTHDAALTLAVEERRPHSTFRGQQHLTKYAERLPDALPLWVVEFDTRDYVLSHGREPRGTGMWAFAAERRYDSSEVPWFRGTYAQARRQARAFFAGLGIHHVYTCS